MNDLKKYSPQYHHINDTLTFVVHLSFLSANCKLIGLNEEQFLEDLGSIPQGWNKSNQLYQFRYITKSNDKYKHNKTILVKILSMEENELLISAVKQGSNDIYTLEITLSDHIHIENASKDLSNYKNIYKDIDGLIILLNDQITHKLIPQKKEKEDDDKEREKQRPPRDPLIFPEPDFVGWPRPIIPIMSYGDGDLDPFGGGGGNLFGPDDIKNQFNRNNRNDPNRNRPPFVPPNARFDPFGPDGMPPGPDPNHLIPPDQGTGSGGFGGIGGSGGGTGSGFSGRFG